MDFDNRLACFCCCVVVPHPNISTCFLFVLNKIGDLFPYFILVCCISVVSIYSCCCLRTANAPECETIVSEDASYILINNCDESWSNANEYCYSHFNTTLATITTIENDESAINLCLQTHGVNASYSDEFSGWLHLCWIGLTAEADSSTWPDPDDLDWEWTDGTDRELYIYDNWLYLEGLEPYSQHAVSRYCGINIKVDNFAILGGSSNDHDDHDYDENDLWGWQYEHCELTMPFVCNYNWTNKAIEHVPICFNNTEYPTTRLFLNWCQTQNETIFSNFTHYLSVVATSSEDEYSESNSRSVREAILSNIYETLDELASTMTDYIICNGEQKNYNITQSQLISFISLQTSQLKLVLQTDPESISNIESKAGLIATLTTDLTQYDEDGAASNLTGLLMDRLYTVDYTETIVSSVETAVELLLHDAIVNDNATGGLSQSSAESLVQTLSNVQETRKFTQENVIQTISIADTMITLINIISQATLVNSEPLTSFTMESDVFRVQGSRFVARDYYLSDAEDSGDGNNFSTTANDSVVYIYDPYSTSNCGTNVSAVTLSDEYINFVRQVSQTSNRSQLEAIDTIVFDCTVFESTENLYAFNNDTLINNSTAGADGNPRRRSRTRMVVENTNSSNTTIEDEEEIEQEEEIVLDFITTFTQLEINIPLELAYVNSSTTGRRRLNAEKVLSISDIAESKANLSDCEVITFVLHRTNDSQAHSGGNGAFDASGDENTFNQSIETYPQCVFWDTTINDWSAEGCYVLKSTDSDVTCACNHATFFGATKSHFQPEINYVTYKDFRDLSLDNLKDYPVGWLTVLVIFVLFWSFVIFYDKCPQYCGNKHKLLKLKVRNDKRYSHSSRNSHSDNNNGNGGVNQDSHQNTDVSDAEFYHSADRRLIMHENVVYDGDWAYKMFMKFRIGKDYAILNNKKWNVHHKAIKLFCLAIKNDHTYFALCCRDPGNGIPVKQRISVLIARVMTLMSVNALFYGNEPASWVGDKFVSLIGAILSFIPPFVFNYIFMHYKPKYYQKQLKQRRLSQAKIDKIPQNKANAVDVDIEHVSEVEQLNVNPLNPSNVENKQQPHQRSASSSRAEGITTSPGNGSYEDYNTYNNVGIALPAAAIDETVKLTGESGTATRQANIVVDNESKQDDDVDVNHGARGEARQARHSSATEGPKKDTVHANVEVFEPGALTDSVARRDLVIKQIFPFPWYCKYFAWVFVQLWTILCIFVVILYVTLFVFLCLIFCFV